MHARLERQVPVLLLLDQLLHVLLFYLLQIFNLLLKPLANFAEMLWSLPADDVQRRLRRHGEYGGLRHLLVDALLRLYSLAPQVLVGRGALHVDFGEVPLFQLVSLVLLF